MTPAERRKALGNLLVLVWTVATLGLIAYLYVTPR